MSTLATVGMVIVGAVAAIVMSLAAVSVLALLDKWMARNDEE